MLSISDLFSSCLSVLLSMVGAVLGVDGFSALYVAYIQACIRLADEQWLLQNCRDPVFFSKMRSHPAVCSQVEANARVGTLWTALRETTDGYKVS